MHWDCGVLTTRPSGKSLKDLLFPQSLLAVTVVILGHQPHGWSGQAELEELIPEGLTWQKLVWGHEEACIPVDRGHISAFLRTSGGWGLCPGIKKWSVNTIPSQKTYYISFPGGSVGKETICQCRRHKRHGFNPWVRKIAWRRKWQPSLVNLPGKFHSWKIPDKPGRLQSMWSQTAGHDWTHTHQKQVYQCSGNGPKTNNKVKHLFMTNGENFE